MKVFVVNGKMWKMGLFRPFHESLKRSDGSFALGVTDDETRMVSIADGLPPELTQKVLCHELCHVYCFSYGIIMPIEVEEIVADFLATYGRSVIYLADNLISLLRLVA